MAWIDSVANLADGSEIGYVECGDRDGRPLVHLHGTPSSRLEATGPALDDAASALGLRLIAPDRPGIGLSPFRRYSVADYPLILGRFAEALGIERFAISGLSGGGKHACACAWRLADAVERVVLIAPTCSFDIPGAKSTCGKQEGQAYRLASSAPPLFRLYLATLRRRIMRDPSVVFSLFSDLSPADEEIAETEEFRARIERVILEAFRHGARGAAHDWKLEARPWAVPVEEIGVPIEIWHGDDDRIVPPEQSRLLAERLRNATRHVVSGEGHLSVFTKLPREFLQSAVWST